jgi:hypothetical protein
MTDPSEARFQSEILSITTANPGWRVRVQERMTDPETRKTETVEDDDFPVVAWALVRRTSITGETYNATEPVFCENGRLVHSTEHRRLHSDVDPAPGQPKITVHIEVVPPGPADTDKG